MCFRMQPARIAGIFFSIIVFTDFESSHWTLSHQASPPSILAGVMWGIFFKSASACFRVLAFRTLRPAFICVLQKAVATCLFLVFDIVIIPINYPSN